MASMRTPPQQLELRKVSMRRMTTVGVEPGCSPNETGGRAMGLDGAFEASSTPKQQNTPRRVRGKVSGRMRMLLSPMSTLQRENRRATHTTTARAGEPIPVRRRSTDPRTASYDPGTPHLFKSATRLWWRSHCLETIPNATLERGSVKSPAQRIVMIFVRRSLRWRAERSRGKMSRLSSPAKVIACHWTSVLTIHFHFPTHD